MNEPLFPDNLKGIEGWYYHINQDFSVEFQKDCPLFPANIWVGPYKTFQEAKKVCLADLEYQVELIRKSIKETRLLTSAKYGEPS